MDWTAIKTVITDETGVSRDALHVLAGVGLYLVLIAVLPRRVGPWLAWLLILLASLANELSDYLAEWWPGRELDTIKDLVTTMALPTLLVLVGRFAPHLLVRPRQSDDIDEPGPGRT